MVLLETFIFFYVKLNFMNKPIIELLRRTRRDDAIQFITECSTNRTLRILCGGHCLMNLSDHERIDRDIAVFKDSRSVFMQRQVLTNTCVIPCFDVCIIMMYFCLAPISPFSIFNISILPFRENCF